MMSFISCFTITILILVIAFVWIWLDETTGLKKHRPFEESYKFIMKRFIKLLLWIILFELVACAVLCSTQYKSETDL